MKTLIKLHSDKGENVEIVSSTMQSIVIPMEVYAELIGYTGHYETEVSGVGLVDKEESKVEIGSTYNKTIIHTATYRVTEIFLPPKQDNSVASTEIKEDAISEIVTRLIREKKDPSRLKLHWHSHVNMGTFHSGVDEENYAGLDNKDFLVSLVTNKKKEVLGRVDIYTPVTVAFINVPVFVGVASPELVEERLKINIEALDKYVAEERSKNILNRGFEGSRPRLLSYVGEGKIDLNKWRREQKIRKKVRRYLNISDEKALKFEMCTREGQGCDHCPDVMNCISYMDEVGVRLAGEGRHVGTLNG